MSDGISHFRKAQATRAEMDADRDRQALADQLKIEERPALAGVKHDQGKPDMSLLSPHALLEVAKVMDFGKKKYAAHNWRAGMAWSRLLAAALRHLMAFMAGEDLDPETGLSHLAHAMCCLMFILEFTKTHKDLDDRYKAG